MTTTELFFQTDDQLTARAAELMNADHDHRTAAELAALDCELANRREPMGISRFETM